MVGFGQGFRPGGSGEDDRRKRAMQGPGGSVSGIIGGAINKATGPTGQGFGGLPGVLAGVANAAIAPATQSRAPTPGFQQDPRFDMTRPGAAELTYAAQNAAGAYNPGPGYDAILAAIQGMGQPNQAEGFYNFALPGIVGAAGANNPLNQSLESFQQNRPELTGGPGLDPYYQRAQERGLEAVNANAAARGAYGSSAALNQGTDLISNLQAEQANREADFMLRQAAENRGWEALGGTLAGALSQDRRGWTGLGADLAGGAASARQQRLTGQGLLGSQGEAARRAAVTGGMNAATLAQNAREGRIGGGFNNLLALGNAVFGPTMGQQQDAYNTQLSGVDAYNQGTSAAAQAGLQGQQQRDSNLLGIGKDLFSLYAIQNLFGGSPAAAPAASPTSGGGFLSGVSGTTGGNLYY